MMTSSNGNIFRVTGPLCGEFTGPGEFPTQRSVTRSFDVFFDLRLNKRLSKQPWGWWFETLSWSLWRHCNEGQGQLHPRVFVGCNYLSLPLIIASATQVLNYSWVTNMCGVIGLQEIYIYIYIYMCVCVCATHPCPNFNGGLLPSEVGHSWTITPHSNLWIYKLTHGPLTRYVKLRVAHAPGMPGTFSPDGRIQRRPLVSDPGMHHGTCVTHVPWCMSESLTRGAGENVPAFSAHAHTQVDVSGKRPMSSGCDARDNPAQGRSQVKIHLRKVSSISN